MLRPGTTLQGRYRTIGLLGQGGMGAVYLADDLRLRGRRCAIKEYTPDPAASAQELAELREQFEVEANTLARLSHPTLPQVSDYFSQDGNQYLVMDYVAGEDLATVLAQHEGPLPATQALSWADQVLDALQHLHTMTPHPVIHRDIKPANLILTPQGQVKLVDFGLAKLLNPENMQTVAAMKGMGTPAYAPIEQYAGSRHTDARSDIYSLGATLYHLLTGVEPPDVHRRQLDSTSLLPLRMLNPTLTPVTEAAVMQAMAIHPNQRFQSAAAFRKALANTTIDAIREESAETVKLDESGGRWRAWPWLAAGGIVVVVVAWLLLANNQGSGSEPSAIGAAVSTHTAVPSRATATSVLPSPTAQIPPSLTPEKAPSLTPETAILPEVTPAPTNSATPPAQRDFPATYVGNDGLRMYLVPAGDFLMGSTESQVEYAVGVCSQSGANDPCGYNEFSNELPQHTVYLSAYYMDATEVTNDQYRNCVRAGACATPHDGAGLYRPATYFNATSYGDYPVVRVTWYDARDYCFWVNERLPTEAEWEKAARGPTGLLFPWGNTWDASLVNTQEGGGDRLHPVASYPQGVSPYGLFDLSGSVWEWVQDWFSDSFYGISSASDPSGPSNGTRKVLRGGSFSNHVHYARSANRGLETPDSSSAYRGFRCVVDAAEVAP